MTTSDYTLVCRDCDLHMSLRFNDGDTLVDLRFDPTGPSANAIDLMHRAYTTSRIDTPLPVQFPMTVRVDDLPWPEGYYFDPVCGHFARALYWLVTTDHDQPLPRFLRAAAEGSASYARYFAQMVDVRHFSDVLTSDEE